MVDGSDVLMDHSNLNSQGTCVARSHCAHLSVRLNQPSGRCPEKHRTKSKDTVSGANIDHRSTFHITELMHGKQPSSRKVTLGCVLLESVVVLRMGGKSGQGHGEVAEPHGPHQVRG